MNPTDVVELKISAIIIVRLIVYNVATSVHVTYALVVNSRSYHMNQPVCARRWYARLSKASGSSRNVALGLNSLVVLINFMYCTRTHSAQVLQLSQPFAIYVNSWACNPFQN